MEKGDSKILVSIICSTYNHEQYIRQCLEGFIMQRTSFAIEVLIHDDASTDKTADIIKEYELQFPELIKPIYQVENQYSQNIDIFGTIQFPRARGKYIALCEGDDYWIDPFKLQRQVDFMEENSDYSMCFHNAVILNERVENREKISSFCNFNKNQQISTQRLIEGWCIPTASVLYRGESLAQLELPGFHSGDYTLELALASVGKVYYINRYMSVYRKNNGGVSVSISAKKWATQLCELLDWYDKYTANRYKKDIDKSKKNARLLAKYMNLKKKCILFPFLFMPYYTFQKLKRKFFN